jgi:hypothetical protein
MVATTWSSTARIAMPTFHTVVPIHNVDLTPSTNVEFGDGLVLTATPEWVGKQKLLDLASAQDQEAVKYSTLSFIVSYDAKALGEPDPKWTGSRPKSISSISNERGRKR